ncbi:helix-turn-helix domain-containing protein [Leptobacterium flavescens]|uniref:Helix-turn-helix domain-containing protein n=1 Tax=Leptobacterium flavescens TaxID=472055 RepID=A0A6P0UIN7_9FLAO|nr:AraC family transcriptional regulator [Leptobacterium flavescens]NER12392.1 helix-turn-helix domain-containing protein [Leptobacterium flavescens]
MKPEFEKIELTEDTSFKLRVFDIHSDCYSVDWHIHPEYEIVYIKNGRGNLQIDKYNSDYEDGVLLFLGPNTPHMPFGNTDFKDRLEVVIQFGEDFIKDKIMLFPEFSCIPDLMERSRRGIIFHPSVKEELTECFEGLRTASHAERLIGFFGILHTLSKSTAFEAVKEEDIIASYKRRDAERINKAFEYVNTAYHKEISTAEIAKIVGLTTNSFCRLFKKTTHKTFTQFINEFRIRKAAAFFDKGGCTVSEVMYKCGYNDPSYFTKQFRRNKGVSPSEYLKNQVKAI